MKVRPIGIVREIIESAGYSITYFYDDLVFADNNLFILQFDDQTDSKLNLYFNQDCDKKIAQKIEEMLFKSAARESFSIENKGVYTISQKANSENLEIVFGQ